MKHFTLIFTFLLCSIISAGESRPEIRRIITLSPHASELVYRAGGGNRLVGVAAFSNFPASVSSLPLVGDATGLDREKLLRLRPDLVVYWHDGISWADREWLKKEGVTLFESYPLKPEQIGEEILALGKLLGTESAAGESYRKLEQLLSAIDLVGKLSASKPLALSHQLWNQPPMVLTSKALLSRTLQRCGIQNPVKIEDAVSTTVTTEYLWKLKTDVIAIADDAFFEPLNPASAPVITVDADRLHRPTLRMIEAALELCLELRQIE